MGLKISLDEIKQRLYKIFGDKYEYDFSNFKNTHSKIGVKCPIHGWSNQILKNLFKGHECNKCGDIKGASKNRKKYYLEEILKKFKGVHGDKYDYSKFNYIDNRTNSIIICPIHGEFTQSPFTHIKGHGCPKCSKNKKFTKDEFIESSNKKHTMHYNYDLADYKNMHKKVKIICPIHGEFYQMPQDHIKGQGCPKCNQSKGEKMIEQFLIKNKINYISQKKFDNCKNKNHLPFDFYLPDYNTCIEFNGVQHYYPIDIFGGEENLIKIKIRDGIKQKYCKENNIKLIIIKQDKKHMDLEPTYNQIENITNILTEKIHIRRFNEIKLLEAEL